jgi:hypothetical protein
MIVWTGTDRQRGMNRCRLMGVKKWVFRIGCSLRQLENVDFAFEIMDDGMGRLIGRVLRIAYYLRQQKNVDLDFASRLWMFPSTTGKCRTGVLRSLDDNGKP